jgi:diamine N-acetyltransferase
MDVNNGSGELGICITPLKQDKHYGTESLKALINYAFNELNLNNIYLEAFKTNLRAIHCYEKVGFVKDGIGKSNEDIHMTLRK